MIKRFLDWLDNAYDKIVFAVKIRYDVAAEKMSDIFWEGIERISRKIGVAFVAFMEDIVPKKGEKASFFRLFSRKVVGLTAIFLTFVFVQLAIGIGVLIGNLLGMRRGVEYRFSENLLSWLPLLLFGLLFPIFAKTNEYLFVQAINFFSYAIILMGLNIVLVAGQISIGHGAFVLIGGYAAALLSGGVIPGVNVGFFPAILMAGGITFLLGAIVGFPATRIKGPYLALMTLGLMISVEPLLNARFVRDLTGGIQGLTFDQPVPPEVLKFFSQQAWIYYHGLLAFILAFVSAHVIMNRSKLGRALISIQIDEEKSVVLGINLIAYKMLAFALSAFYAGMGGALLALNVGFIAPGSVTLKDSIDYLIALAIGGIGHFLGVVVGGSFLLYRQPLAALIARFTKNGEQLLWAFEGGILILVLIFAPNGLIGGLKRWIRMRKFQLPKRRHHRRFIYPDYDREEEHIAIATNEIASPFAQTR